MNPQDDLFPETLPGGATPGAPALESVPSLLALFDAWAERGWLRALDRAFTGFLAERCPEAEPLVLLAAALASHQLGHGHVCLDLRQTLAEPDFALSLPPEGDLASGAQVLPSALLAGVDATHWAERLAASPLLAGPGSPMVLAGTRLYLRRYWHYERQVDHNLHLRLRQRHEVSTDTLQRLEQLFPADGSGRTDWQKLACALAMRCNLSIITGGPGTGKTTTVVRLLALLQGPRVAAGQPLRIRLAAPTGKAAARLTESIGAQVQGLQVDDAVKARIPVDVTTVHRLLGSRPGTRHFRHNAANPLPLDVLVVDEASMIDLEMMAHLLAALAPGARLVLLGDKDQLASVEAGAVLGDLCRDAEHGRYSPATQGWLEQVAGAALNEPALLPGDEQRYPLAQQVAMLRYSRRFGEGSGIGALARRVNAQDASAARRAFSEAGFTDLHHLAPGNQDARGLRSLLLGAGELAGYRHYLAMIPKGRPPAAEPLASPAWAEWARAILAAFDRFQLLCAVRKGPWGVEGLNARAQATLASAGLIDPTQPWYEGRPVLMTRNDYGLGLMNGDIGITLSLPQADESDRPVLRVAFPRNDGQGGVRFVLPSRLSDVETVYAMTVHKSQGSEFEHTALVLPEALNPVLTKELIYTGITRAKQAFTLVEPRGGVFEEAVRRRVKRLSGLMLEAPEG